MMQTDILLKQVSTSLQELQTAIDKFEKHTPASTEYTERLHQALNASQKLVSAYLVFKEQKDVSPELDLHLKLMAVPMPDLKTEGVEMKPAALVHEVAEVKKPEIEKPAEVVQSNPIAPAPVEKPVEQMKQVTIEKPVQPVSVPASKEYPRINININDKFRFINELFKANLNEYNIAVEQINSIHNPQDASVYLKGLQEIYGWNEDNEVVKRLFLLTQKRFS